jgi:hypothetical protein
MELNLNRPLGLILDEEEEEDVQTSSGAHPTSYPPSQGIKRPRREADHSPPTSAEIKNMWIYTSIPPYVFIV